MENCLFCFPLLLSFSVSRLSGRQGSPDSMVNSYHGNTANDRNDGKYNRNYELQNSSLFWSCPSFS